jgi:NADH-quinone oxidoreductase subunit L
MKLLLALIPFLPFAGFLVLALFGGKLTRKGVAWIGAGSVSVSAILTLVVSSMFLASVPSGQAVVVKIWEWMNVGGLSVPFSFRLDALSMVFIFVITFVGALIHIYSVEFMSGDEGYSRFFASMNLFVSSMLILVLADNLLLLYLGWEGVGLCSYLLICLSWFLQITCCFCTSDGKGSGCAATC